MSNCTCVAEIEKLQCQIDALKENQDQMWSDLYQDEDPFYLYFAGDTGRGESDEFVTKLGVFLENKRLDLQEKLLGVFLAGDLNYPSGASSTLNNALAPFLNLISDKKLFPVMGNHDIDSGQESFLLANFPYLPLNGPTLETAKRNYYIDFSDNIGSVVYAFDPYYKTASGQFSASSETIVNQKQWFYDAVQNINTAARFHIPVIHHPCAVVGTALVNNNDYFTSWDLEFAQNEIDLVVNGHAHNSSHIIRTELSTGKSLTNFLNCSSFGGVRSGSTLFSSPPVANIDSVAYVSQRYELVEMRFYRSKVLVSFIDVDPTGMPGYSSVVTHSFLLSR